MVVLTVPGSPALGVIAAASAHGLTDLQRPPAELLPYGLVFLPLPSEMVTPLFILCSVQHFSRDIGYSRSIGLHATFALLNLVWPIGAWGLFAIFYCGIHVPRHCMEYVTKVDWRFGLAIILASVLAGACVADAPTLSVNDFMQLGVVAHILVDEISGRGVDEPALPLNGHVSIYGPFADRPDEEMDEEYVF